MEVKWGKEERWRRIRDGQECGVRSREIRENRDIGSTWILSNAEHHHKQNTFGSSESLAKWTLN
jgi:hypothetical protein